MNAYRYFATGVGRWIMMNEIVSYGSEVKKQSIWTRSNIVHG